MTELRQAQLGIAPPSPPGTASSVGSVTLASGGASRGEGRGSMGNSPLQMDRKVLAELPSHADRRSFSIRHVLDAESQRNEVVQQKTAIESELANYKEYMKKTVSSLMSQKRDLESQVAGLKRASLASVGGGVGGSLGAGTGDTTTAGSATATADTASTLSTTDGGTAGDDAVSDRGEGAGGAMGDGGSATGSRRGSGAGSQVGGLGRVTDDAGGHMPPIRELSIEGR